MFTRTIEKLLLLSTVPTPARAFAQSATDVWQVSSVLPTIAMSPFAFVLNRARERAIGERRRREPDREHARQHDRTAQTRQSLVPRTAFPSTIPENANEILPRRRGRGFDSAPVAVPTGCDNALD